MTWRKWWIKPLQQTTLEVQEEPEADAGRQTDPRSVAADPARLLNRKTSPGVRTRSLRWLGRTYGNRHVQRLLYKVRRPGQHLDDQTRRHMESAFGEDFSDVRVHTDTEADTMAVELGARAFTSGQDISFASGEYRPDQPEGKHLLAHELAHVIQGGEASATSQPRLIQPGDTLEQQAESVARRATAPGSTVRNVATGLNQATMPMIALSPQTWDVAVNNALSLSSPDRDMALTGLIDRAAGLGMYVAHATVDNHGRVENSIAAGTYQELGSIPFHINFDWRLNQKAHAGAQIRGPGYTVCQPNGAVYLILGPRALRPQNEEWTRSIVNHEMAHAMQCLTGSTGTHADAELEAYSVEFVGHWHRLYTISNPAGPECEVKYEDFLDMFDHYARASSERQDQAWQRIQIYYRRVIKPSPRHLMVFKLWLQDVLQGRPNNPLAQRINRLEGLIVTSAGNYIQCPVPPAGTTLSGLEFVPD